MNKLERYELTRRDYLKNRSLVWSASLSPVVLALPPFALFLILFLFSGSTSSAALYFFLAFIGLGVGFALGILLMIALFVYRNSWLKNLRERLAVDGIKPSEVDWFKNELTTAERQSLKELESSNRMLAEAYRETLASRLTGSRILKSTKQELQLVSRRQNKLKYLKNENSKSLHDELNADKERLEKVRKEADELLTESKTRLEMIEAAARRGSNLIGNEQALERLLARTEELPLALQAARIEEEVRREMENEQTQS
ncbi:MAG TPA: hypothetical protein VF644_20510 [Pyrinomonadaceae bacterium]|jgi:uncharacterized membrane protein YgaE (UPF0421/DUF939 family)